MGARIDALLRPAGGDDLAARAVEDPAVGEALAAAHAELAAELFPGAPDAEAQLAVALDAAAGPDRDDEGGAIRLAVVGPDGPRAIVAVRLPARRLGPGAPSADERLFEAGLRIGAAAGASREIVLRWAGEAGQRGALWRGARLGAIGPGEGVQGASGALDAATAAPSGAAVFADGGAVGKADALAVEAITWVRRVVETPPNLLGPAEFAAEILAFADSFGRGVRAEVWEAEELAARGFGATLGVGGGSARPPRLVRLGWGDEVPDPDAGRRDRVGSDADSAASAGAAAATAVLGIVGKGITFDSGGLNLKRDSIEISWMKADMAAAAASAAAVILASRLGDPEPGRGVVALLPLCDNAVSGTAQRPGDVVRHPDGSLTEVVDTDCEGRLVISDGLAWCRLAGCEAILDAGTLTDGGAGLSVTGLWSNDEALTAAVRAAACAATDPVWPIPLPFGEEDALESRVAAARNAPLDRPDVGRHAALFLARLAGETPWCHFDIGGTAYLEAPHAGWPAGPTGAPTRAFAAVAGAWVRGELLP